MMISLFSATFSLMGYRVLGTCLGLVIVLLLLLLELGAPTRAQRAVIFGLCVVFFGAFGVAVTMLQRSIR